MNKAFYIPKVYKRNPMYVEKRDKRLQLLVTQSILDKLKEKANQEGRSVNDLVNCIFEDVI